MQRLTHKCPAPECDAQVPRHQLACRRDWLRLPPLLRERIWVAYRHLRTADHRAAVAEAIEWYRENPRGLHV